VAVSAVAVVGTLVLVALLEFHTAWLQSLFLADLGSALTFRVEPGPNPSIRFPPAAPYDDRLGYAALPKHIDKLAARGFTIESQARSSPELASLAERGFNLPYREKSRAGLDVRDCRDELIFRARYPERVYDRFEAVPPLLANALLFIENRKLLDDASPRRNPAIDWSRLGKALMDQGIHLFDPHHETPGGSTLATQIEKYRHSPEGRTNSGREKLRQMASASMRAYLGGTDTTATRRNIVLDYLNTVPLAARLGIGEVNGMATDSGRGTGVASTRSTDCFSAKRHRNSPRRRSRSSRRSPCSSRSVAPLTTSARVRRRSRHSPTCTCDCWQTTG
jgi:hypothetical protein